MSIFLLIDLYVFKSVKAASSNFAESKKQIVTYVYWGLTILVFALVFAAFYTFNQHKGPNYFMYYVFGIVVLVYIPKILITLVLIIEDVYRLLRAAVVLGAHLISKNNTHQYFESRKVFLSQAAILVASIPFLSILYGIVKGKYNYTVHRTTLKFKDLPEEFHGFTITQLSDIHAGSFDDKAAVERGIALANEQKSDLFLFTGDLVNNIATEMDSWVDSFSKLKAPYGQFSVFGNHDYADYINWETKAAKQRNLEDLKKVHQKIGFRLLLNEHVKITKGNSSISLIGIENWGLPPFPQYGDLNKAMSTVDPDAFKILMSHDPSHWDAEAKHHEKHIHLSLAGHTHGMQFGIEIPGFKWSPVKYRYPKWAGLYSEGDKHLYVNRGFGFLGFPGRVGIWPEVTVITLERA